MYDVVIVGSGGAALSCAIVAKQRGLSVMVVSKSSITSSQTSQAQGGINCVLSENDSVETHISDTLRSSAGLGNEDTIRLMCENGKETIDWLDKLGVPFSRDENNGIAQRKLGGASHKRACYSSDYTGLKILHTLYDTAIKLGIEMLEHCMLLDLIKDGNDIFGITYLEIKTSQIKQITASNTVIATGGYSGVYHGFTTNSKDTTGDGIMAGFRAGVELENMEFVQFHPTALKTRFTLISESARGEGGFLVTKDEKRFVDELLPRDVVAREIYKKLQSNEDVFLDIRHLGYEKILHLLPQEYKLILKFTLLKMDKDLIPITPATHYTMGGLKCDKDSKTSLNGLYVIGEASSNGVHGANRLGGNSLLEIVSFGKKLGEKLWGKDTSKNIGFDTLQKNTSFISQLFENKSQLDFYSYRKKLGEIMFENVGLFRSNETLMIAYDYVEFLIDNIDKFGLEDKSKVFNTNLCELLEFKNMIFCAKAIILSAKNRCESRGSHYREDFIDLSTEFKHSTLLHNNFIVEMSK
ncbi:MAG: FAD-dependent oxidoreductase [Arcobacter sp.]|nr:FAD-dependent oxidoreductase [Arcobacter sp.]